MSAAVPYRPCPACGGTSFHQFPDVGVAIAKPVAYGAIVGHQEIGVWWSTLVVCARCGKTDVFTKNAAELREKVPGASQFIATPPAT